MQRKLSFWDHLLNGFSYLFPGKNPLPRRRYTLRTTSTICTAFPLTQEWVVVNATLPELSLIATIQLQSKRGVTSARFDRGKLHFIDAVPFRTSKEMLQALGVHLSELALQLAAEEDGRKLKGDAQKLFSFDFDDDE